MGGVKDEREHNRMMQHHTESIDKIDSRAKYLISVIDRKIFVNVNTRGGNDTQRP